MHITGFRAHGWPNKLLTSKERPRIIVSYSLSKNLEHFSSLLYFHTFLYIKEKQECRNNCFFSAIIILSLRDEMKAVRFSSSFRPDTFVSCLTFVFNCLRLNIIERTRVALDCTSFLSFQYLVPYCYSCIY